MVSRGPALTLSQRWLGPGQGGGGGGAGEEDQRGGDQRAGAEWAVTMFVETAWLEESASKLCYYQSVKYYDGQSKAGAFLKFLGSDKSFNNYNAYLFQTY